CILGGYWLFLYYRFSSKLQAMSSWVVGIWRFDLFDSANRDLSVQSPQDMLFLLDIEILSS
ncbi:hypothetical protein N9537_03520, partial [Porticoccaceae bacterium]|nr:hypothetical protein [Porticoccaceae bacterium]